ncbi:hypothetical protein RB595_000377 [Gaeumannomyces hyphopodioides]
MPVETRGAKARIGRLREGIRLSTAHNNPSRGTQGGAAAAATAPDTAKQPTPAAKKRRRSPSPGGRGRDTGGAVAKAGRGIKKMRKSNGRAAPAVDVPTDHTIAIMTPPKFETLTWGIKQDSVLSVEVCLRFRSSGSDDEDEALECFSVRLLPDNGDQQQQQQKRPWCSIGEPWSEANSGARLDNFLTYDISRKLHAETSGRGRLPHKDFPETAAADLVEAVVRSDPGRACAVCGASFGDIKLWRPTPCSAPCKARMQKEVPLEVRVSPLLVDYRVLDFLLACAYSFVPEYPSVWWHAWPQHPPPMHESLELWSWGKMAQVLESFQAIDGSSTLGSIVDSGTAQSRRDRKAVLSWLSTEFQGCLVSASAHATVEYIHKDAGIRPVHQFILLNSTLEREIEFKKKQNPGLSVFHATPAFNIFPLLMDGLRSMPTPRGGRGIYFAGSFRTSSYGYQKGVFFRPWPQSIFASFGGRPELVFGAEYRGTMAKVGPYIINAWSDARLAEYHTYDQSDIALRYVFLSDRHGPATNTEEFLPGSRTREVMEDTFHSIKNGEIAHLRGPSELHRHRKRWMRPII